VCAAYEPHLHYELTCASEGGTSPWLARVAMGEGLVKGSREVGFLNEGFLLRKRIAVGELVNRFAVEKHRISKRRSPWHVRHAPAA